jgi:ABC-type glycerol-3-phosphate transport system substrate-binding protein
MHNSTLEQGKWASVVLALLALVFGLAGCGGAASDGENALPLAAGKPTLLFFFTPG